MKKRLETLRHEIERINLEMLDLLCRRGEVVTEMRALKNELGIPLFSPEREERMLRELVAANRGPYPDTAIQPVFREIFRASLAVMEAQAENEMRVSRGKRREDLLIAIGNLVVGREPIVVAGPCAIESEEQLEAVAAHIKAAGVTMMRGGAFKPRSSPYAFQGLGDEGLVILQRVAKRHGLLTVTEVTDTRSVDQVARYADVLQVGARNMANYEILREVGRTKRPVLLKRGMAATIDELLWAAEYIVLQGNEQVILCERGIRTFERATRNTLDISAIPLLRQRTYLPVIADVSHAAGRRDILAALARAALAAGAQGVMVEVHPDPPAARSDAQQQLSLEQFTAFMSQINLTRPHAD